MIRSLSSIETVFFTFLGYPVSYLEFAGTLLYLWSVWLIAKRNILTWPVGILSVLLFTALFYQVRLYSDVIEQLYYLGACSIGWWYWTGSSGTKRVITGVRFGTRLAMLISAGVVLALSLSLGAIMSRIHLWLPTVFSEAAAFPYLDALTTIMSFVAMWLMVRKRIESWAYWIIVDIIGIGLYFVKSVPFVSLLYVILLALAIRGFIGWTRSRPDHLTLDENQKASGPDSC